MTPTTPTEVFHLTASDLELTGDSFCFAGLLFHQTGEAWTTGSETPSFLEFEADSIHSHFVAVVENDR